MYVRFGPKTRLNIEELMLLWAVVLKTLESSLDCKEIKPVNSKGHQSWIFIRRTDAETEAPIIWPPDVKSWLIRKDPVLGKIEGRKRREWQKKRWLNSITNSMDMCMSKFLAMVTDRQAWRVSVHGFTKSQTQLSYWKTTANIDLSFSKLPSQRKVLLRLCVQMKKGFFKWQMSKSLLDLVYSKLLMHLVIYLMCFLNTFIQSLSYADSKSWKMSELYEYSHMVNLVVHIWFFYYMFLSQADLYSVLPDQSKSGATGNCFL